MLRAQPGRTVRLAGATADVEVRRLVRGPEGSTLSEVTFPPGWSRPAGGWFDVAEEVVWLDGSFTMTGRAMTAGTYAWFPAGFPRRRSGTDEGARALAWFAGPPTWIELADAQTHGEPPAVDDAVVLTPITAGDPAAGPIAGTRGRLLRRGGDGRATWLLDDLVGGVAPAGGALVAPLSAAWGAQVEPGAPIPPSSGPTLCVVAS